jgi:L-ascorbate metabolism protein UlaG (beta-lactamase superfamily)
MRSTNRWFRCPTLEKQTVQMANDAGAERILPVHHQTFHLSNEPLTEPIERLLAAAAPHADRVALGHIGEEFRA